MTPFVPSRSCGVPRPAEARNREAPAFPSLPVALRPLRGADRRAPLSLSSSPVTPGDLAPFPPTPRSATPR
ncbi:MAG: hypothetical protein LBT40_05310, partial [Deltaproteobacteria bacterium]|nr:hypothetical protein [Deltaproteobacteria bacterium]